LVKWKASKEKTRGGGQGLREKQKRPIKERSERYNTQATRGKDTEDRGGKTMNPLPRGRRREED